MSGFHVRPARSDERFEVLALCRRFHAASGVPFDFDPAHASITAQRCIDGPEALCLALEADGALRGVLAALTSISPLAPVRVADELIFWVDPAFRGRGPRLMLKGYEDWARAQGCVLIGMSALNDPRVSRFYGAAGFRSLENKFYKKVS